MIRRVPGVVGLPYVGRATSTPGWLRLLSAMIAAGAVLLGLAGSAALVSAQRTVEEVGQRTIPAIIGAQRIHALLADADRSAADTYLLSDSDAANARIQYADDIGYAMSELELTAEQNSAGPEASESLREISLNVTQYTGLVDAARANKRQGFPVGVASQIQAAELMHFQLFGILTKVDRLADLNSQRLADEDRSLWFTGGLLGAFALLELVLVGVLLFTQGFLRRRFRRRYNTRLLASTGVLVVLAGWIAIQGAVTYRGLREAERDVFPRLHALYQARSLIDDISGNESLALIEPARAAVFYAAIAGETRRLEEILGRDAPAAGHRAFEQYLQIDAMVRDRAASDRQAAVRLALGTGPGQLGAAFRELDAVLEEAIGVAQRQFDDAIAAADPTRALNVSLPVLSALAAFLALWGLQPRLAEYRA